MFTFTRGSMIARLALVGAVCLVTLGTQARCSASYGSRPTDPYPGSGDGPTFSTTLILRNSAGMETYRFARGELIYFEISMRNSTRASVKGSIAHEPSSDYLVFEDPGAAPTWQWSEGKVSTAEAYSITIPPGESRVFGVNWNQDTRSGVMLPPGTYQARGIVTFIPDTPNLLTPDELRTALKEFTVN